MRWVEDRLRELADKDGGYRAFNARIVATADPATMLGVRVPRLRRLAREVGRAVRLLDALLPFVDNWCVCVVLDHFG
ncbi:hypothetical protein ACTND8_03165 [Atopobiaceae bacterium HCP3S3_F7]